jgi:hypothetical protein
MISSVVIVTWLAARRSRSTASAPRVGALGLGALTIRTILPSSSKSISVFGRRPASSRIHCGIVTWPFDVMRSVDPPSYR